jgi:hypothetical protein
MTTQQKIEFYLNKGFACDVKFEDGKIAKIFFINNGYCCGNIGGVNTCWSGNELGLSDWQKAKVTPIPPKPYEFKVGERVMVLNGVYLNQIGEINSIVRGGEYDIKIFGQETLGRLRYRTCELAPSLPEDEECEVVEVSKLGDFRYEQNEYEFTKPDGKKLKIKVIKK